MRTVRLAAGVAVMVASVVLGLPSNARATVSGTFDLRAGFCKTAESCLLVGDDISGHGAIVPFNQVATQSQDPACSSDAETVDIALQAYLTENPGKSPTTPAAWRTALLSHKDGGPYLEYWPSSHYFAIEVAGTTSGTTSGDHVKTHNGDVIVIAVDNGGRTYDYTVDFSSACQNLNILVRVTGTEVSDGSTNGIVGLACPAGTTTCYGVTQNVSPSEGTVVAISVSSPARPTVTATDPVSLTTSLSAIACPTPDECVAVGAGPSNVGDVVPIVDGVVGSPVSDSNTSYRGIACVSSTLCIAVGTDTGASEGVLVPIHLSPTLSFGTSVDVATTGVLQGASCPTPSSCYAVGAKVSSSGGVVVPFSVSAGMPSAGKVQSVAGTSQLAAVECLGANECDAVGVRTVPGDGVVVGVSEGKPGAAHEDPSMTSIFGITCIGDRLCFGLGTEAASAGVIAQLPATIGSSTSVVASSRSVRLHDRVAFLAVVGPAPVAGTVAFTNDGHAIPGCGAVAVRAGVAGCATIYGSPGKVVVRATYSGDADVSGSTSKPVIEVIAR